MVLIVNITISLIMIGSKNSYFPLKADLNYRELKNLTTKQNKLSSSFNTTFYNCQVVEINLRAVFKLVFAEK